MRSPARRPCRRLRKAAPAFQINLFWVIVSAANFIVFFLIVRSLAFKGLEQDPRRPPRAHRAGPQGRGAGPPRPRVRRAGAAGRPPGGPPRGERHHQPRPEGRRRRAREQDIAATREELARLRERAAAEIEAEKQRAIAELRGEVTDLALAAAGRVVGESMTADRQRKLVADFLAESAGRRVERTDGQARRRRPALRGGRLRGGPRGRPARPLAGRISPSRPTSSAGPTWSRSCTARPSRSRSARRVVSRAAGAPDPAAARFGWSASLVERGRVQRPAPRQRRSTRACSTPTAVW